MLKFECPLASCTINAGTCEWYLNRFARENVEGCHLLVATIISLLLRCTKTLVSMFSLGRAHQNGHSFLSVTFQLTNVFPYAYAINLQIIINIEN